MVTFIPFLWFWTAIFLIGAIVAMAADSRKFAIWAFIGFLIAASVLTVTLEEANPVSCPKAAEVAPAPQPQNPSAYVVQLQIQQ